MTCQFWTVPCDLSTYHSFSSVDSLSERVFSSTLSTHAAFSLSVRFETSATSCNRSRASERSKAGFLGVARPRRLTGVSRPRLRMQNTHKLYATSVLASRSHAARSTHKGAKKNITNTGIKKASAVGDTTARLSFWSQRRASSVTRPSKPATLTTAGILALCSRARSVCLAPPWGKLGRAMFEGVIGKVGTTSTRIAERRLIPQMVSRVGRLRQSNVQEVSQLSSSTMTEIPRPCTWARGRGQRIFLSRLVSPRTASLHLLPSAQPPQPRSPLPGRTLGSERLPSARAHALRPQVQADIGSYHAIPSTHHSCTGLPLRLQRCASCLG